MSVPKQRHTKERRDRKRKRFALRAKGMQKCPKCSAPKLPHQACAKCGYYKNREVIDTLKKTKKEKKK
jgi:large subunit ribosomal protein L32